MAVRCIQQRSGAQLPVPAEFQHRLKLEPGIWDSPPSTGQLPHSLAQRLVTSSRGTPEIGITASSGFGTGRGAGTGTCTSFATARPRMSSSARAMPTMPRRSVACPSWPCRYVSVATAARCTCRGNHLPTSMQFYEPFGGPWAWCALSAEHRGRPAEEFVCGSDLELLTTYVDPALGDDASLADDRLEVLPVLWGSRCTWDALHHSLRCRAAMDRV